MDDVVNSFNIFFVSVGPKLAEEIQDPVSSEDWNENLIERNSNSMLLTEVEEKVVINIVNKCKYKTSTDHNDVDMKIVKKVIEGISKPVTYTEQNYRCWSYN